MRYAVNELMMDGKNILSGITVLRLQQYVVLYFVFKDFYGMTPLHYVSQHRERTVKARFLTLTKSYINNGISDNPVDNNSTIECRRMI